MELVYPIYIDTPMMTSFLASLEGGYIEEATVEEKSASSKEKDKTAGGGAKLSGLLSSVLSLEAKAEASQKTNESVESNYKSTVRFPEASLFIRLRELLRAEGLLRQVTVEAFDDLKLGELIEFSGNVAPTPTFQIRRLSEYFSPLMESMSKTQKLQTENQIQLLDKARVNQPMKIGDQELVFKDKNELDNAKLFLKIQLDSQVGEAENLKGVMEGVDKLMPYDEMDKLIFDMDECKAVCSVYPLYARNKRIQDIHYAHWSAIGKVIGKIESGDSYNLTRNMPGGNFTSSMIAGFALSINNGDMGIDLTETDVEGPVFIVATLAIFA